jgi:hypothetical protein
MSPGSSATLPPEVRPPFTVYINGVAQQEGTDYRVEGRELVFDRELPQDKVGFWRWALGAIGIGTYRADHSVDVRYELPDGRPMVAERLPVRPRG